MSPWRPSEGIKPQWERLQRALPEASGLVDLIVEAIIPISAGIWDEMSEPPQAERRDQYLIRYTVPLAEIAGWPSRTDSPLFEALALHWMFAVAWRRLDDVLDSSAINTESIARLGADLLRLGAAHRSMVSTLGLPDTHMDHGLMFQMCNVSTEERLRPLPTERIWERASPFFVVPRSILRFTAEEELIYRDYLCADGLTHDIHDLADDLARGIQSLPAFWLQEIDPRRAFRREILEAWFHRAEEEVSLAVHRARNHDPRRRYRALAFWLDAAEEAAAHMSLGSPQAS